MRRRELLGLTALAAVAVPWRLATASGKPLAPLAAAFIDMMVSKHGFDRAEIEAAFADLQVNQSVIDLIKPAKDGGRKIYWDEYRARHVTIRNISNGVVFAGKNSEGLAQATRTYGVPAHIIAAIIGIETRYGTYTGKYRSLEALGTLALAYPPRADYFMSEMEQLFLYARSGGIKVTELRGSYAGAMGVPQFMPSSARKLAVDFDGDGKVDLFGFADAIGSVANFLAEHGWARDLPVAFPISRKQDAEPKRLLDAGIVPSLSAGDFSQAGMPIEFDDGETFEGKLALVDLENEDSVEYRAGTVNYYALTRYNRSNKYAMAVLDLANEINKLF